MSESKITVDRLWNPMFISLFISSIIINFSAQMSNSLLSLYAKHNGAPADQVGSLMSLFALTALIMRFIAGPAMNAYDRKRLLQLAMSFFGLSYLGYSVSPLLAQTTGINIITIMKIFRLIQGMGNAFGNACLMALVSDCIPKDQFSSGMAVFALAQAMSQAIGPTVGETLKGLVGYNMTYLITGIMMFVAIIMVNFIVKIINTGTGKMVITLNNMIAREALVPAVITFFIAIGFTSINSFLLVYAEERGIQHASLYFPVYAVVLMATRPIVGKLTDKYGFVRIAVPSLIITALSLFLIGQCSSLVALLAVAALNSFGYGAVQPSLQSLVMKSVPSQRRGSASSTNYIAMDSATLIGPMVCGYVAKAAGYTPLMWTVVSIPVLFAVACVIIFRKRIKDIEENFVRNN